ncbi:hypothetical protein D3C75_987880 [compost metagenome]
MQRLSVLQHDIVGNVDNVIDRTHSRSHQAVLNPERGWGGLHPGNVAHRIMLTVIFILNLDRDGV